MLLGCAGGVRVARVGLTIRRNTLGSNMHDPRYHQAILLQDRNCIPSIRTRIPQGKTTPLFVPQYKDFDLVIR